MRFRAAAGLTGIGVLVSLLAGCSPGISPPQGVNSPLPADQSPSARVVVTRDFGKQLMLSELVAVEENTPAMDALMEVAEVETAYGGGFVNGINGLCSGYSGSHTSKEDWFFYVNGISSNVGALDYTLYPGDTEHWDFRNWGFHQFVPAIIGDFPEPFLNGCRGVVYPTLVVYQAGWAEEATQIAESLAKLGVADVSVRSDGGLTGSEKEISNLILVGTSDFSLIEELNRPWERLGFYCHFQDGSLRVFDAESELAAEYGSGDAAGVVQATQSVWNPKGVGAGENVVWIVSGTDEAGVAAAVTALAGYPADFEYAFSVVIVDGEIVKVPR